jgi:hypothetical protein
MSARKSLAGFGLTVIATLALAACGSSNTAGSGVSGVDPAAAAPADSLVYVGITARPQGSAASQIAKTINKLAGKNVTAKLPNAVDKALGSKTLHLNYRQMKSWLGKNIGFALVKPAGASFSGSPANSIVFILPTDNTSAAASWAKQAVKHQGSGPRAIYRIAGGFLLIGGKDAVSAAAAAAKSGNNLASSNTYKSDSANLASDSILQAYLNAHGLLKLLGPELAQMGATQAQTLKQLTQQLGSNATVAYGLELKPNEIRLDLTHSGHSTQAKSPPSNVGALPADSWLAISDNKISSEADLQKLESGYAQLLRTLMTARTVSAPDSVSVNTGFSRALTAANPILLIDQDLIPALGPLSMSIAGTSPLDLKVGLDIKSVNKSAQTRLLSTLYAYARRYLGPSQVKGSPDNFAVQPGLSAAAKVTRKDGRVVATYGYPDPSAFLHPSTTLAANAEFKQAMAQLPSGSSEVPLYLRFGGFAALASIDKSPSDASTMRVLRLLNYAIVGGTATDERIVIGLH